MTIPVILGRLRSIIHSLAFARHPDKLDRVPGIVAEIGDIVSVMLDFSSDMNTEEIHRIGKAIDVLNAQISLLNDHPECAHDALVAFTNVLRSFLVLLRGRRDTRNPTEHSPQDHKSAQDVWKDFYLAVDEYASESEDPGSIRDLYDELIVLFILESEEKDSITEKWDPKQSPEILTIVKELTRGLVKLRNTPP